MRSPLMSVPLLMLSVGSCMGQLTPEPAAPPTPAPRLAPYRDPQNQPSSNIFLGTNPGQPEPNLPASSCRGITTMLAQIGRFGSTLDDAVDTRAVGVTLDTVNYADNANCVWLIEPIAPTKEITLSFNLFQTEKNYDFLKMWVYPKDDVRSVADVLGTKPTDMMSGDFTPPPKMYETDRVLVQFLSDGSKNGKGFAAAYSTDEVDKVHDSCYGVKRFDSDTGIVTTGGTTNYPSSTR